MHVILFCEIVVPSTPAQYFHVLRRQMRRDFRKPLFLFTPKSLLRNRATFSSLLEFGAGGKFFRAIRDHSLHLVDPAACARIRRDRFWSGKFFTRWMNTGGST